MGRLRRLLGDVAIYAGGRAAGALVPFLLLPFLTRHYTAAEFGTLELLLVIVAVLGVIVAGGVPGAYLGLVRAPDFDGRIGVLLGACAVWFLLWPPLLLVGAWVLLPPIVGLLVDRPVTGLELLLCCWMAFAQQVLAFVTTVLRMDDRAWSVTLLTVGAAILAAILTIAIVLLDGATAAGYLLGFGLGLSAATVAGLWVIARTYGRVVLTLSEVPRVLRVALPLVPGSLAELSLTVADRIIIAAFLDTSQLAVYAVAVRVAALAQHAIHAVMMALLPLAIRLVQRHPRPRVGRLLGLLWRYLALAFLVGAIAGGWLAPPIVRAVATPEYAAAAVIVPYLILAHVFYSFTYVTYIGTLKAERTHFYSLSVLMGAAVNVTASLLLTPALGVLGAALGTLAGTAITPMISLAFSQRVWPMVLPAFRVGAMSGIALLCIAAVTRGSVGVPDTVGIVGTLLCLATLPALAVGRGDATLLRQIDDPDPGR